MQLANRSKPKSSRIRELLALTERPGMLSLAGGLPAPEALPAERIGAAIDRILAQSGPVGSTALQYGPTDGLRELREVIAERESVDPTSVLVTTGSQQALDLIARAILDPGDAIAMAEPCYLGAAQTFAGHGGRLIAIETDEAGLIPESLAERLDDGLRPKAVYVVANFDNPTGVTLPLRRRRQLAALADHYGFVVIEDDPYGSLRFSGDGLPAIASLGTNIARLGTASKTVAPGLRVGWLTAPADLRDRCSRIKQAVDLHTATLNQLIVAELFADTSWHLGHIARLCRLYAERAEALSCELQSFPHIRFGVPRGGMFLWARFVCAPSAEAVLERALDQGVAFVPGSAFGFDGSRFSQWARMCFATLGTEELREAARRLRAGFELCKVSG